ncbi:MAG: glycosyltransferase [Cyclobacteriaceae bacterium]
MKILFLAPYPYDQAPSQRFRFEQYFHLMESHGIQYSFQSFLDYQTWEILYQPGFTVRKTFGIVKGTVRRLLMLFRVLKYDKVFIHREAAPIGPPVFEWLVSRVLRKEIIFDFDDAIWLANTSKENAVAAALKWHSKTAQICRWSRVVSVGNAYLADYAGTYNSRVCVNPTTINTEELHLPTGRNNKIPVIGWTGTHSTGKYLSLVEPMLWRISKKHKFRFLYISNQKPAIDLPNLEYVPWNKETEVEDLNRIDIGLMPLENDAWAMGKCGFKALQYMALQIPTLASPVGVNRNIIDDGINGFLCRDEQEWQEQLELLLMEPELREKLGKNGRKKVVDQYSVMSNTENFIQILKAGDRR